MNPPTLDHEDPIETRLRDAGSRTVPIPPLAGIETRARQVRRRRAAVRSGATLTLAAAAVAGVVLVVPALQEAPSSNGPAPVAGRGSDGSPATHAEPTLPASGHTLECRTGYGYVGAFSDVPDLLYLPSSGASGSAVASTLVRLDRADCDPQPMAAIGTRSVDGVVRSAVKILGPDAAEPYTDEHEVGGFAGRIVDVAGVPGSLKAYLMAADTRADETLVGGYWTDPHGVTWWITTQGLTTATLSDLVSGLRTDDRTIDPSSLPSGYEVSGRDDLIQPTRDSWSFRVGYASGSQDGEASVEIRRGQNFSELLAAWPQGKTFDVEIDGHARPALWFSGKLGMLAVQLDRGVVATVTGFPEHQAVDIVESLRKVRPDDHRLIREDKPRDVPEN